MLSYFSRKKHPWLLTLIYTALVVDLFCGFPIYCQESDGQDNEVIELFDNWQYRLGDSPIDEEGRLLWLNQELSHPEWTRLETLENMANINENHFVWYRIKLPDINIKNPTLFFSTIVYAFEVYLNEEQIFRFDNFRPTTHTKFAIVQSHLIPLKDDFQNKILTLRIYSDNPEYLGIRIQQYNVLLGNHGTLIRSIVQKEMDSVLLGFLFISIGLFSIFIFLKRFKERAALSFSFCIFALFIGFYYVMLNQTSYIILDSPIIIYYMGIFSFLMFPVGLYSFLEYIIGRDKIIRTLWLMHLAYAFVSLFLDLLNIVAFPVSQTYYMVFFTFTIIISISRGRKAAARGIKAVRIFHIGFFIFGLTGLHDILTGFRIIPYWHLISHWGMFILIITLAYIIEHKYADARQRLVTYSTELEIKSQELEKYSQTLEEQVTARTAELNTKNATLEKTLIELKEAQNQLIIKEKMASLGNLVAGVAHEVNTPIGAISSAANVLDRGLGKITGILQSLKLHSDSENDGQLKKAISLLHENTKVIMTGSQRVAKIVRTLRNFARLDESEYKQVDVHEGIESTLTLLNHEIKNKAEVIKEYGNIPPVNCYPDQLNQVILNILVNAAQAIENQGTIKIKTFHDDNNIFIAISDNGVGIPRESIDNVFDPGYTTKGVGVGTGLGLSISYNIIQKHGGEIRVESELGKGATFTIVLPIKSK